MYHIRMIHYNLRLHLEFIEIEYFQNIGKIVSSNIVSDKLYLYFSPSNHLVQVIIHT